MSGSFIGWFAITGQLYLILHNRTESVPETLMRFFTFFTILSNIIAAVYFTMLLIKPASRLGKFLSKPASETAIAVYITIVGLVYNLVLRFIWAPHGFQRFIDEMLHLIVPFIFILYWSIFLAHKKLYWKNIFVWLLYPLVYIITVLVRGIFSGYYPYPFIDVGKIGYSAVFINSIYVSIAFITVSLIFIGITKWMNKS
ncbi:MAG: Pr6Pr family membrane protein [Cytophagales bacterium]|nr:Pr6Pr family membrane protein [Cytophaga sp.]